jgi:hypothetical protein
MRLAKSSARASRSLAPVALLLSLQLDDGSFAPTSTSSLSRTARPFINHLTLPLALRSTIPLHSLLRRGHAQAKYAKSWVTWILFASLP